MTLTQLETPALLLDQAKLDRNIERMRRHLQTLGVGLRPHVKTAKSIEVVRRALAGQPGGITVSTLREAEYFFEHGIRDILYAVGIAPNKLTHVARLRKRGADVTVVLDNRAAASAVIEAARTQGDFRVMIEIDSDGHRAGLRPGDPRLTQLGAALHEARGVELRGVMTHAGESYNCPSADDIVGMAERERAAVVQCAAELRAAGLPCPVVSVGSTPTATFARDLSGVTEVRAGVYMLFDLVMAGIGVCQQDDIALSVLTSVIGHQPDKNWIITDGGWMAMSRDRGTARQSVDQGYGVVCGLNGVPHPDLVVRDASQEHGIISSRSGAPVDMLQFEVGTLLRILPNHACATAAQHPRYQVLDDSSIIAVWDRIAGW
jgi:D-serine deaminase-like pyridoxal phosphate-dependent protein